jgi:hypothetical protein
MYHAVIINNSQTYTYTCESITSFEKKMMDASNDGCIFMDASKNQSLLLVPFRFCFCPLSDGLESRLCYRPNNIWHFCVLLVGEETGIGMDTAGIHTHAFHVE